MKLSLIRAALDNPRLNPRNIHFAPRASYKLQFGAGAVFFVVGWTIGKYIEEQDNNRMTRFRDKSALYGSEKGPDDAPSWGCKDEDFKWNFSKWPRSSWY